VQGISLSVMFVQKQTQLVVFKNLGRDKT